MYTPTPESDAAVPATKLIPTIRQGQPPIAPRRRPDGGYTVEYDKRRFGPDEINEIMHALGIPPARPISAVYSDATAAAQVLADAEIAAHPGCAVVEAPVWGDGILTIREPRWCTRPHVAQDGVGEHPQDVYHSTEERFATVSRANGDREDLISAWLSESPFLKDPADRSPCASVCFASGDCEEYDEAGLDRLAHELRAAAAMIDGIRAQLHEMLAGPR
ncbi:DUF6907 domain-containing protein [Kitasatospora cheerisanensis]|uniref:Uncharacterized protein n=1 Tax=Kitasatospora cheerisanensis KCTC 2395 TaxID=1348663 RepID=A0A066YS75_9ACTN|nr:hypothetical protein [Kitasatospora cheerisanensis]KDN84408.1 hypothetical protein KCH_41990 [Kitasatospora cheerisanensis KCTC 2395]